MKFSESLKKNIDFRTVYRHGLSYADRYLVMYIKDNKTEKNRLGISVSKKVGNSVVRHRLNEEQLNRGLDIVVIARVNAKGASYHQIEQALLHLADLHAITLDTLEKKMESF